ncbi:MAG: hypothetical protein M3354_11060 [Chloroflexota bacterium]|nr:hypothetical protein [Chloroflexota bacterium]
MRFATADNRSDATAGDARSTSEDKRDPAEGEVPGTGIMGDETLVRDTDGEPGIYPAPPAPTGGEAHPGPAKEEPSE